MDIPANGLAPIVPYQWWNMSAPPGLFDLAECPRSGLPQPDSNSTYLWDTNIMAANGLP